MQPRKNKRNVPVIQPWYMVWVFYILNLFRRQAEVAHLPPRLPDAPKAASPKSPGKKQKLPSSTHKRMSTAHAHAEKPESPPVLNRASAPAESIAPPLQTFSIIPDEHTVQAMVKVRERSHSLDEAVMVKKPEKKTSAPKLSSSPKAASIMGHSVLKSSSPRKYAEENFWEDARDVIINAKEEIKFPLPAEILESPINQLVDHLAFLYRYHLTIIAVRGVIKKNFDGGELERSRILLAHNTDAHLFKAKEFEESRKVLATLELKELSELRPGHVRIDGFGMTDVLQKLPLYTFMKKLAEKPAPDPAEKEHWITQGAIPLLNRLFYLHAHTKNDQHRIACNHAIKMLVIIMGENNEEKVGKFEDDKPFTVSDAGTYEAFLRDCKKLRNFYAHKFPRKESAWVEEQLFKLGEAALKVNGTYADSYKIETRLSPYTVRRHYEEEVRKSERRTSGASPTK